ncbi:MAG TPA: carbonate dehydratase [Verrucomicrobiales bacterium]|nr:carbonate dehydratase [Verrucomicrobiales bacterium]
MKTSTTSNSPPAEWHQLQQEEVVQLLKTDLRRGLSAEAAAKRLAEFGPNVLSGKRGRSALLRFLDQFHQALVYILVVATIITASLGEWVDAGVIFGVVLVNAIIGFIQESKAGRAIEALSRMVTTEATVRRDGQVRRVNSADLVPGDVVLLQSGDRVPADLRLFHVKNLHCDESALTGESLPVPKHSDALSLDTILAERKNNAYAGTLVTYGQAEGVVWGTGNNTETGRIARLISEAVSLSTPLTRKIAHFSKLLLWVILGFAALTFAIGLLRGGSWVDMFMAAVALAVGAIPEGLPAAVTITLAVGVARMARRRAIIRKLPAVETLGSTTVICSDKTGTLTENQMTVRRAYTGGQFFEFSGSGYDPRGEVTLDGQPAAPDSAPALAELLKAGLLCNDSQLVEAEGRWKVEGDPTEGALIVAAGKLGYTQQLHAHHPRLDSIPFESEFQFMATLHGHHEQANKTIYKKGSTERLLARCTHALATDGSVTTLDREAVERAVEAMANEGLRVLAFARKAMPANQRSIDHQHVAGELIFLGLQGMIDPPRQEAIASVRLCQEAGIRIKMITGDHLLTAQVIARQLGIRGPQGGEELPKAVSGRQLEKIPDQELPDAAEQTTVFARVAPEQKLRLVRALQSRGHVVAMTGDGVNDAPALKQADIGVAMGRSGTEVAKGAADMLLTDDNFASIEAAVEEGRGVFDNLTKFIVWTLPTNAGEALVLIAAIIVGTMLPVQPVQLLWINMTTAICLGLMLVFEPKEKDIMRVPPRDPRLPLLRFPVIMRTGLVALLMASGAFGIFLHERRGLGSDLATAQTLVMNVIVFVEVFYLLNCRSLGRSIFKIGFFSNPWIFLGITCMVLLQLAITYVPLMNRLFHTAPLPPEAWAKILSVGVLTYMIVGLEKTIRRRVSHHEIRE